MEHVSSNNVGSQLYVQSHMIFHRFDAVTDLRSSVTAVTLRSPMCVRRLPQ